MVGEFAGRVGYIIVQPLDDMLYIHLIFAPRHLPVEARPRRCVRLTSPSCLCRQSSGSGGFPSPEPPRRVRDARGVVPKRPRVRRHLITTQPVPRAGGRQLPNERSPHYRRRRISFATTRRGAVTRQEVLESSSASRRCIWSRVAAASARRRWISAVIALVE